jgi:hypothetical protein
MWVGAARRLSLQRFGVADYAEIRLSGVDCSKHDNRRGK